MGKKTSTSTQTVSIPPEVLARYNAVNARAEQVANKPYQYYGGEFVAPLTSTQRAGMANINNAATMAQPYYASATNYLQNAQAATQPYFGAAGDAYGAGLAQGQGYLGAATDAAGQGGRSIYASDLNSEAINKYMSPYLQNVLQGTAGLLNQQNQQAMSGQTGNAIRQGAFGGDRGGIAAANLQQQQRLADASIFSNILNQGYNNALNTAVGQQQINLSADQANRAAQQSLADRLAALGQQGFNQYSATGQNVQGLGKDIYNVGAATSQAMAGLGTGAQNAAIQGGQAQMEAGGIEQATKQAEDTALYNQFKEAQSYPFQTAQFLANIAQGTGALSGSTTTTKQPGGFFSDERMKENIQKVGKTYDGQNIYRYNYKGDDTTHIGLIAQEVEDHHPEAVGLAGGMKTVNYDKATDDAAHMAEPHKGLGGFLSKVAPVAMVSEGVLGDNPNAMLGGLGLMALNKMGNKDDGNGSSMGGSVAPQQAGEGFASGGLAGHAQRMAALYDQLYSSGSGRGINGMQGIPVAPSDIPELMIARGFDKNGNPVLEAVNAVEAIGRLGNKLGAWRYGERSQQRRQPMDEQPIYSGYPKESITATYADGGMVADPALEQKRQEEAAGLAKAALEASKPTPPAGLGAAAPDAAPVQSTPITLEKNKVDTPNKEMKFGTPSGNTPNLPVANAPVKPTNHGSETLKDFGQMLQIAGTIAGMASDKRMKENIQKVGKTFDGQNVYRYNYKGDPTTRIGLIAQEVEHHHPEAVGLAGGMKTVNYDKATNEAADRGSFHMGHDARMHRDMGGGTPYATEGKSIVPESAPQQNQLMTAAPIDKKASGLLGFLGSVPLIGGAFKKVFSDERMKENIRPIGELFDGQKVYSYNLKGDHRTQIGLLAQEVEHHKPRAVGLSDGMKTVDYHDATQRAAHRGHFAEGGMPEKINPILEELRKSINPRFKLTDFPNEQDAEMHREMHPDSESDHAIGGLKPITPTVTPETLEASPSSPIAPKPKPGLVGPPKLIGELPTEIAMIARMIRQGEGTGQNPKSTAYGPYQMINDTFVEQFRKYYPEQAKGMSYSDIVRLKHSPEGRQISDQIGPRLIAENAKTVARGGFKPDAGNVYLAHFVGAGTALKLLRANPNDSLVMHVGQEAVDANPMMQKNPTVGSFVNAVRGYIAKQRPQGERYASGGLAGRHGYQTDGTVVMPGMEGAADVNGDGRVDLNDIQFGGAKLRPVSEEAKEKLLKYTPPPVSNSNNVTTTDETPPVDTSKVTPTDTTPPPEKRAGLAKRVFGYDPKRPYDRNTDQSFFHRLGHGETDAVIAALQGLAAMGTAPTRSLGVALAAGLGAGATGYQQQREFGRQLRETAAVEQTAQATEERAKADVATAMFNLRDLPAKIAGWRRMAQKGGPAAAIAAQTADRLQNIYDNASKTLGTGPKGGLNPAAPAPATVEGTPETTSGGLTLPPVSTAGGPKPGTIGELIEDVNMSNLTGVQMGGTQKQLEMAASGYKVNPDGTIEADPDFTQAKIKIENPQQVASQNTSADIELGTSYFNSAQESWKKYQPIAQVLSDLNELPIDTPTTNLVGAISIALGKLQGLSEDQITKKYGSQPNINDVLRAAQALGIPVDPTLGPAGIRVILNDLNRKAAIAMVSAQAANQYYKANGFRAGMQDFINRALRLHRLF